MEVALHERAFGYFGQMNIHPVTSDRWVDLETLFGPNGAYSGCWCMFLRQSSKAFEVNCPNGGGPNRRLLRAVVDADERPGLLAYADGRPVGWVAVAPRAQYPRVLRSPVHRPIDDEPDVWAITCFFIAKDHRGMGVADRLLRAGVEFAAQRGARIVEAYPIDNGRAQRPAADMWRGSMEQFLRAGFAIVARRRPMRPIVRLFT